MRKTTIIIFIIFIFSMLCSEELNKLTVVGKAKLVQDIIPASIKDANNRRAACIVFLTDLTVDMDFRPNIELVKLVSKAGRYEVFVQPRERVIEVFASGFKPLNVVLSTYGIHRLESGEVYEIEITGNVKTSQIPVVITSNQNNAEIFVDGKSKGKTANKMLTTNIGVGTHKIKVIKDGFVSQEITETISEKNNSFNFRLTPAMPVAVTINTTPEGAIVYIDNIKFGTTPKSSFFDEGTYPIRIEKENYETINEQITITEPETKKNYTLTDIRANLTVKTYKNATVSFNGQNYKGGFKNKKLSPQILEISVTMPKAEPIKRIITLKQKANETLEIYPEIQTGIIQVITIPAFANIELKGDGGEHYTATGRKTFVDVPVGKYDLIIKADNHKTHKESFILTADKTERKQITLEEGSDIPDNMIFVKGGTFLMGSNNDHSDEKPVHSVTVSDFYIGKYEVTQKEWKEIIDYNPSYFKGDNLPVDRITWYDAIKFCNAKSKKEGLTPCYSGNGKYIKCNFNANGYRLPTEAEWEYAARGGQKTLWYKYAGSNNINYVAWYRDNSGKKTHPVGTKQPNELGIYDMSGNVEELCWDWYGEHYYKKSPRYNPHGPNFGRDIVSRGGDYLETNRYGDCPVRRRNYNERDYSDCNIGFRIVKNAK